MVHRAQPTNGTSRSSYGSRHAHDGGQPAGARELHFEPAPEGEPDALAFGPESFGGEDYPCGLGAATEPPPWLVEPPPLPVAWDAPVIEAPRCGTTHHHDCDCQRDARGEPRVGLSELDRVRAALVDETAARVAALARASAARAELARVEAERAALAAALRERTAQVDALKRAARETTPRVLRLPFAPVRARARAAVMSLADLADFFAERAR